MRRPQARAKIAEIVGATSNFRITYGHRHGRGDLPYDLVTVCLWSVLGVALVTPGVRMRQRLRNHCRGPIGSSTLRRTLARLQGWADSAHENLDVYVHYDHGAG